jgi:hypothetical protein
MERDRRFAATQHLLEEPVVFHGVAETKLARDVDRAIALVDEAAESGRACAIACGRTKEPIGKDETFVVVDLDVGSNVLHSVQIANGSDVRVGGGDDDGVFGDGAENRFAVVARPLIPCAPIAFGVGP